jgi:hypothetical protein
MSRVFSSWAIVKGLAVYVKYDPDWRFPWTVYVEVTDESNRLEARIPIGISKEIGLRNGWSMHSKPGEDPIEPGWIVSAEGPMRDNGYVIANTARFDRQKTPDRAIVPARSEPTQETDRRAEAARDAHRRWLASEIYQEFGRIGMIPEEDTF